MLEVPGFGQRYQGSVHRRQGPFRDARVRSEIPGLGSEGPVSRTRPGTRVDGCGGGVDSALPTGKITHAGDRRLQVDQ